MLLDAFYVFLCQAFGSEVQAEQDPMPELIASVLGVGKVTLDSNSSGYGVGPSSVRVKDRRVLPPSEAGSVFTCGFCCLPRATSDLCSDHNPQLRGLLHIQFLFLEKVDTVDFASWLASSPSAPTSALPLTIPAWVSKLPLLCPS